MIGRGESSPAPKVTPQRGVARGLVAQTCASGRGLALTPSVVLIFGPLRRRSGPGEVAGQQAQVVGQHDPSHIGIERSRPFPQTPFQTKAAQKRGEVRLSQKEEFLLRSPPVL